MHRFLAQWCRMGAALFHRLLLFIGVKDSGRGSPNMRLACTESTTIFFPCEKKIPPEYVCVFKRNICYEPAAEHVHVSNINICYGVETALYTWRTAMKVRPRLLFRHVYEAHRSSLTRLSRRTQLSLSSPCSFLVRVLSELISPSCPRQYCLFFLCNLARFTPALSQ